MRYEVNMLGGSHRENVQCGQQKNPCVCVTARNEDGSKGAEWSVFEARWYGRNGSAVYDLHADGRSMWVVVEGPIEIRTEKGWEELP